MIEEPGLLPPKVDWARRGFWARFTPDNERAFRRFYERDLIQRVRWSALVAALVMIAYSLMDILMIPPGVKAHFLLVRWGFMILPLFGLWWLSTRIADGQRLQKIAASVSVSSALAVVAMIVIARLNGTPIEYEGILLTIFYFYCCGGLRLRWASLAGWTGAVGYLVAEYFAGLSAHALVVRGIFLVSANVVGLISAALMELLARRSFAQLVALEAMSRADPLTGLLNRRALDSGLPGLIRRAAAAGRGVQTAMVDVDYFKQYNDHYGHAEGDLVLREVAAVLTRHSDPERDLIARYGGEEFFCCWVGQEPQKAAERLEAILRDVRALELAHSRSPLGGLSVSIGSVALPPGVAEASEAASAALREADALLYRAKSAGRNRAILAQNWQPGTEAGELQMLAA